MSTADLPANPAADAVIATVATLPQAPLAMPRQRLEAEHAGWLRTLIQRVFSSGPARTQG